MKTKNISFLVLCLLLSALFGFYACEKEKSISMPALTFSGKNTFGCYVNGKLFVAVEDPGFMGSCGGAHGEYTRYKNNFEPDFDDLSLSGADCELDNGVQIVLTSTGTIDTGTYILMYPQGQDNVYLSNHDGAYFRKGDKVYSTNDGHKGVCRLLKFDTINNIASGTFEFEAMSKDSVVIRVTEGRFDIKFSNNKQ